MAARLALFLLFLSAGAAAQNEADYRRWLCEGYPQEVPVERGTRADCLIGAYAVEIDWSENWHQALGQSLYYAQGLNLSPAIILICKPGTQTATCRRHFARLKETSCLCALSIRLWFCIGTAKHLQECEER